ncbi:enoyl-CoA hydratase/isomerase family protein [Actinacidiphila sp. ITFR-21]|uniref:enoyl-CoA hydratase/isomerase family protein n=1 Tax=Actinacidiphila sp. ITFR-21 TaxID=3075199 RepID=UPI00288A89D6|nr:enoyl-CoA hydratase/isomerase family protein [Streptomyces sp. ITFR-21]WNI19018.1 enoyl-CoA hydratase/isomerase family protein [Streptomyces sp. ITFR-21]
MTTDITEFPQVPYKELRVTRSGPVLRAELNSPGTGNALTGTTLDELLALLDGLRESPEVRVLVLSGAGDDFCVGADRVDLESALDTDPRGAQLRGLGEKARRVCEALENTHAVTIARLHGRVIGAGVGLALFCDLRAAADSSRFRLPELALGLPPAWGGMLPRLLAEVGAARVRELVITGATFDASTAFTLSIVHRVVLAAELDTTVENWVKPLVRRPPEALRLAKLMLNAYAKAGRFMDGTLLDSHLFATALAAHRRTDPEAGPHR